MISRVDREDFIPGEPFHILIGKTQLLELWLKTRSVAPNDLALGQLFFQAFFFLNFHLQSIKVFLWSKLGGTLYGALSYFKMFLRFQALIATEVLETLSNQINNYRLYLDSISRFVTRWVNLIQWITNHLVPLINKRSEPVLDFSQ